MNSQSVLMTTTNYTVTCLSPVHIGTGEKFGRFDGFSADKKWWLIDIDRVVARGGDPVALAEAMKGGNFSWSGWLRRNNIRHADVAVYSVTSWFDPGDLEIREAMKDVYHHPYLPGSSVKGAIRTAILWHLLKANESVQMGLKEYLAFEIHESQKSERYVAQPLEWELFGRDPANDLMKSLHVIDSAPTGIKQILLGETATYSLKNNRLVMKTEYGRDFRLFVEWLIPQTALDLQIGINEYLFTPAAKKELGFSDGQEVVVRDFVRCCNEFARALLDREQRFYAEHQASDLVKDCSRLREEFDRLPPGAFMLNVGWGGGWESKTVGDVVRELLNDEEFRQLRQRYELGKSPDREKWNDRSYLDHYFPHSRHLAQQGGVPRTMGWVKFEPKQAGAVRGA